MSRILSNDISSKYSLSHSSKSVLTVSGLQFTTTVLLPSWRSVRILETAHQSNSTLLPARRQKSREGKDGCREENKQTFSAFELEKRKIKELELPPVSSEHAWNLIIPPRKLIIHEQGPPTMGELAQLLRKEGPPMCLSASCNKLCLSLLSIPLLLPLSQPILGRTQEEQA